MNNTFCKYTCIRFLSPPNLPNRESRWSEKVTVELLRTVLPPANPDFGRLLNHVYEWLLESETETGTLTREISLDRNGNILMIMPVGKNYGYWTDSHLLLKDFMMNFHPQIIPREHFDASWIAFANK